MKEYKSGMELYPKTFSTCLKFGGNILVSTGNIVNRYPTIALQSSSQEHEIGKLNEENFDWDENAPTVYLVFNNVKSVEVLERALNRIKEELNRNNKEE